MAVPSCSGQQATNARQPPGGVGSIVLGDDSTLWSSTSAAHSKFDADVVGQATPGPRMSPGGKDSVQLGGAIDGTAAEELLARPSPGGADSVSFGQEFGDGLPVTQLLSRFSVGGPDSVNFASVADNTSSETLLQRPYPGGSDTVVLGGDIAEWTTNSQAVGVGGASAVAGVAAPLHQAPGGTDSINFGAKSENVPSEVLLARPSPGGVDSVDFQTFVAANPSAEMLLARPSPGGYTGVVLGNDSSEWTTNSKVLGVGSVEAVAAAETHFRNAPPGGVDSIDFNAKQSNPTSEMLLARPYPGGNAEIVLGGEKSEWTTNSSALGNGSAEAVAHTEAQSRQPPGGLDSVNSMNSAIAATSVEELMTRPQTGGKASVVLGGDSADWVTSTAKHGLMAIPSGDEGAARQAPGGVDSVVFGAADVCPLTAAQLHARPAPGGADSVHFGQVGSNNLAAVDLLTRPSPGGAANIVLGSDGGGWATSSQHHNCLAGYMAETAQSVRLPPGGVDSVVMAAPHESGPSAATLRARPACGGAATVVLGGDGSDWTTSQRSVMGAGCTNDAKAATIATPVDTIDFTGGTHTPAKPRVMRAPSGSPAATATLTLGDIGASPEPGVSSNRFATGSNQNQGNWITDRSSTRLHQAPGGQSSVVLGGSCTNNGALPSANRFASGSNQNQGNVITDRPTTKLHQAPGGNSSINLGDERSSPDVGVSMSAFAKSSNPNAGLGITERSSTKVRHAPGGNSSLCLGDGKSEPPTQDENVNNANIQPTGEAAGKLSGDVLQQARQAPGGAASVVLG